MAKTKKTKKNKNRIIISSRIFIPHNLVEKSDLRKFYSYRDYDDMECKQCPIYKSGKRHLKEKCDDCDFYKGRVNLYKKRKFNGIEYYGIPTADPRRAEAKLGISLKGAKDLRADIPMKAKLKFVRKLRDGSIVDGKQTADQVKVVNEAIEGLKKYHAGILQAPPRFGKCVTGDTYISTNKGIIRIDELFDYHTPEDKMIPKVGLNVETEKGVKNVSHIYTKTVDSVVRVTTKIGAAITGTPNHPLMVLNPDLTYSWKNLEDIKLGDMLCMPKEQSRTATGKVPSHIAYIMGYVIANSTMHETHSWKITAFNREDQKRIVRLLGMISGRDYSEAPWSNNEISIKNEDKRVLLSYGMSYGKAADKVVPDSIMRADIGSIKNFLRAYIHCDGYISNTKNADHVQICTASEELSNQLYILLLKIGAIPSYRKSKISWARNSKNPVKRKYYIAGYYGSSCDKIKSELKFGDSKEPCHNYMVTAIPYVRDCLVRFCKTYGSNGGWFTDSEGNKEQRKLLPNCNKGKDKLSHKGYTDLNPKQHIEFIAKFDKKFSDSLKGFRDDWVYTEVDNIEIINEPTKVYDICVPSTHSFLANGLVSHNTACTSYIVSYFRQRTIIFANKEKLLKQFKGTFEGDDKYLNFTNAKDEEERLGRPVVKLVKTPADFKRAESADIVLVLYQKLIRSTSIQRVYDFIIDKFGLVIVDEVHRGSADGFARLLLMVNPLYKLGLSATPKNKKNERNLVLTETMGRVIAKSDSINLSPRIEVFETGLVVGKPPRLWVYAIKHLCNSEKRNIMIVREVFKDIRAGRKAVLIPVAYTNHMQQLVDMINEQADYNNRHKGENWPIPMAVPYCGAMPDKAKDSAMERFDKGEAKVMVAMTSMVVEGVDLSIPDTLYQVIPMSAKDGVGAPAFEQLTFRVSTPAPGKTDPVVKMFIDGLPQSYWCFRSTFLFEVSPGIALKNQKYRMNKYDFARAKEICDELASNRTYVPQNMLGTRVYSKDIVKKENVIERRKAKEKQKTVKKDGLIKVKKKR